MEIKKEYYGEMIHEWKDSDFGEYVITGMIAGENTPLSRIGKLAQIRLEAGDFGSNMVLLRQADGILRPHENQAFFRIPKKYRAEMDEFFKDVLRGAFYDKVGDEYTLQGKFPEIGFIIPSKIKDGESTPMREIENKIYYHIEKDLKAIKGATE